MSRRSDPNVRHHGPVLVFDSLFDPLWIGTRPPREQQCPRERVNRGR